MYFYYFCKVVEFRKKLSKKVKCGDVSNFYDLIWNYSFLVASELEVECARNAYVSRSISDICRDCAHLYFDIVESRQNVHVDAHEFKAAFACVFDRYLLRAAQ